MITEIQIENFRCFKERTIFPLSNINLLYGDNNSGKTTFLRALNLLQATFSQTEGTRLRMPNVPYDLGSQSSLCHVENLQKNHCITFRIKFDHSRSIHGLHDPYPDRADPQSKNGIPFLADEIELEFLNLSGFYFLQTISLFHESERTLFLVYSTHEDKHFELHECSGELSDGYFSDNWLNQNFINRTLEHISKNKSFYTKRLDILSKNIDKNIVALIRDIFGLREDNKECQLSDSDKKTLIYRLLCFQDENLAGCDYQTALNLFSYHQCSDNERPSYKAIGPICEETDYNKENPEGLYKGIPEFRNALQNIESNRDIRFYDLQKTIDSVFKNTYFSLSSFFRNSIGVITENFRMSSFSTPLKSTSSRIIKIGEGNNNFHKIHSDHNYIERELGYSPDLTDPDELRDTINKKLTELGYDFSVQVEEFEEEFLCVKLQRTSKDEKDAVHLIYLADCGDGVSELIHNLIELYDESSKILALEEPEIHLHPKLQKKFIGLCVDCARSLLPYRQSDSLKAKWSQGPLKQIILDTHSEIAAYTLLDRISKTTNNNLKDGEEELHNEQVQFLHIEYLPSEQCSVVNPISAGKYGTFSPPWPGGFFDLREED